MKKKKKKHTCMYVKDVLIYFLFFYVTGGFSELRLRVSVTSLRFMFFFFFFTQLHLRLCVPQNAHRKEKKYSF